MPRGPSVREKYSWRWEDSWEANRFTWAYPHRLIYETAAVLSVRTSTCLPNSSGRNCSKARCTVHTSRQLMCQSSRGPVQSPEAACPLHVAPQPVLEASVVTTVYRDTCSRGTPARRKARSVQGLRERRHCWVIPTRRVPRHHSHLGTREYSTVRWSHMKQSEWRDCSCGCHMPQEPLKRFQWCHIPASEGTQAVQHCLGTFLREVCHHTHRVYLHTEKRDSLHRGELALFPVDPKPPLAEVPKAPSPCDRTNALWIGPR